METITLRPVTEDNFDDIVKLSDTLTEYQRTCVAPNVVSLAQAYIFINTAWPRAIYKDELPIGFVMLSLTNEDLPNEDQPAYYLWRFMIAFDHQKKGYGKNVLDQIIEKCRKDGIKTLYTSCETSGEQPYRFYIGYGFIDTQTVEDGEQVLKYTL